LSRFAQFEQLIQQARRLGFEVRYEYLDGGGGGVCEFGGKRWLFVDLSLSVEESWELLQDGLRQAVAGDIGRSPESIRDGREVGSLRKVG
jgi:hypothetical protein